MFPGFKCPVFGCLLYNLELKSKDYLIPVGKQLNKSVETGVSDFFDGRCTPADGLNRGSHASPIMARDVRLKLAKNNPENMILNIMFCERIAIT